MAIINQFDNRNGITYINESISYWDMDKKQPQSKRNLIGKREPNMGEIIPTDGRYRKCNENPEAAKSTKPGLLPIETPTTNRRFYGATYLLDEIGNTLGLTEDLKQ